MRPLATLVALSLALASSSARAYCPSYTPAETSGGQNCGVDPAPGKNPTSAEWKAIFAKVAPGQASWGSEGPAIGTIGSGCGKPKPMTTAPAHFPCHVLEAIAMQESSWTQFCVPDSPSASVGAPSRTIVSFDCGYGVGQVTSGMHVGENPAFDRAKVVSDPTYNLATGTLILADKWRATHCVGDNDPDVVEDWYTAIWAYNGLAYSNNPNDPSLDPGRGVYDPAKGGSYTYQERVMGWMEHPPSGEWPALAPAYPNRADVGGAGAPPDLPEPDCASPTDCTTKRATHASVCEGAAPPDAGAGGDAATTPPPNGDAGAATQPDGGALAPVDESGCSCRTSSGGAGGPLALVAALLAVANVRRRAKVSRDARPRSPRPRR